jgi:hypothetical protein
MIEIPSEADIQSVLRDRTEADRRVGWDGGVRKGAGSMRHVSLPLPDSDLGYGIK